MAETERKTETASAAAPTTAASGTISRPTQSSERGGEFKSAKEILRPLVEELKRKVESMPDDPPELKPACQKCGDTGFVDVEIEGKRGKHTVAKRCECRYEIIIRAQLPQRFHSATLDDFDERRRTIVLEWLGNPRDGLFLFSPAGRGKTHLAAAIVRHVITHGGNIRFRRAAQLFQAIRDSFGNDSVSEAEVLSDFVDARMLVLDDLGTGSLSDLERRYTLEVLDSRLNANRPTIITSNLDLEQIRQAFDERIASRLATFKRLNFSGDDRRKGRKSA